MMRRAFLWLGFWLAIVPSCGPGEGSSRLAQGSSARAYSPDQTPVRIFFAEKTEQTPSGTRVKVLADTEAGAGPKRRCVVAIEEGAFRGMAGQMERGDIKAEE